MKRIVSVIIVCLIMGVLAYFGTYYMDKLRKGGEVNITVTFDDTETYVIPSIKKMNKEEALKEWPYIMEVNNTGSGTGLYQIIITDIETSSVPREKLEYALFLEDKEIVTDLLKNIKNNVLYTGQIKGNTKQKYKLYIWVKEDVDEKDTYEYKLEFNTIRTGGPGF